MDFQKLLSMLGYAVKAPGMGISEPVGTPYDQNRTPQNVYTQRLFGVTDPSKQSIIPYSSTGNTGGYNANPNPQPFQPNIQSATTGGGGGGTGGGGSTTSTGGGSNIDEVALARAAREAQINDYKTQADNMRSQGQSTFDNLLKSITAFRDRSGVLRDNANQEIVNKASSMEGTNARTSQDLEGKTRAQGRALGLGDSSKFLNQNKLAENLATTQGNTLARQGEEDRSNQALYQDRQDQANTQEGDANTYLKGINDNATQVQNSGINTADSNFVNSLNGIANFQRSLAMLNPLNMGGLTGYNPNFSGITNAINSVVNSGANANASSTGQDFANPVDQTNILKRLLGHA